MSDSTPQSPDRRFTTAEIVSPLLERREPSAAERLATSVQLRFEEARRNFAVRRGYQPTVLSFTGYGTTSWIRVLSRVVMASDEAFENGRRLAKVVEDGVRGWRNFVSPPVPFAEVQVKVGEQTFTVQADRGGVVDSVVEVQMEPGWQTIQLWAADREVSASDIFIVHDEVTTGLVSDIDDTVVVTALPRPLLAAWNSFVLDEHARTPTPGMAVLMHRVLESNPRSPVVYLSTGAWNVAQTLSRFLSRNLYPFGPLLLTAWGPTEDRWFRSGMEHKVTQLERLAQDFPHMKWLLVGDDGQHDPEIYADFARRHPEKVRAIVIRQLTPSEALLAGGRASDTRDTTPGVPWCYGPDGASLAGQLEELGVVDPDTASKTPLTWPRGGTADTSDGSAHSEQARG